MKREQRLRSAAEFSRARDRAPRAWAHPLLVLYAAPNDLPHTRVGITVSRRVGKAVVRNKVRRRIREATRLLLPRLRPGHDLVLIARPASAAADWRAIQAAVQVVVGRAGLLSAATNGLAACVWSAMHGVVGVVVRNSPAKLALLGLIRVYQSLISAGLPPACRFEPTCSRYAYAAIERYGALRGGWLAARRLLRCHPWGGSGYDPVP